MTHSHQVAQMMTIFPNYDCCHVSWYIGDTGTAGPTDGRRGTSGSLWRPPSHEVGGSGVVAAIAWRAPLDMQTQLAQLSVCTQWVVSIGE